MITANLVSSLVSSLAWPVASIVGLLLIRRLLINLVPLIRTLRYSDLEVRFGREVVQVRDAADAALIRTQPVSKSYIWEDLIRLSSVRPRSAIRDAWRQVELALAGVAKSRALQVAPAVWSMPMVLGSLILNAGFMSDAQYNLLSRLRLLTSEAERAPADSLNSDDAAEFVGLALRMTASLGNEERPKV